jgi:hypothetical protein
MPVHSPLIRAVKSEWELNVSWEQGILKRVGRKYTKGIGRAGGQAKKEGSGPGPVQRKDYPTGMCGLVWGM